jgi:hypothetical protein
MSDTTSLLNKIDQGSAAFSDVLAFINERYDFSPTAFDNGSVHNAAGENSGSCRVFAFAQLHGLSVDDTVKLFAEHAVSVLAHPNGSDHQNIRNFIQHGWAGIRFTGTALSPKA